MRTFNILLIACSTAFCCYVSHAEAQTQQAKPKHSPIGESSLHLKVTSGEKADDPLHGLFQSEIRGRAVYAYDFGNGKEKFPSHLVIRTLGGDQPNSTRVITYTLEDTNSHSVLFDPQFSPDGGVVLFKIGNPFNTTGKFKLYVLNIDSGDVALVSKRELSYSDVLWSPDGSKVAFIEGGDYEGNVGRFFGDPLRLLIHDFKTGAEQVVSTNNAVRAGFSWASPETLLYSVLIEQDKPSTQNPSSTQGQENTRPDIYEYSSKTKASRLLIKDGVKPLVSPDGKSIAFFGSPDPSKPLRLRSSWVNDPGYASLIISNYEGTDRKELSRQTGEYPLLHWSPDNKHLLALNQVQPSPEVKADVNEWDIVTRRFKIIARLQAQDSEVFDLPHFTPIAATKDSKLWFVKVMSIGELRPETGVYNNLNTLVAINVDSGEVTDVLSGNISDWYPLAESS